MPKLKIVGDAVYRRFGATSSKATKEEWVRVLKESGAKFKIIKGRRKWVIWKMIGG